MLLILEDDKNARQAIGHLLERAGYEVETACGAGEAIERAEGRAGRRAPDLVIADARDAEALASRFPGGEAIPVVLLEEPAREPQVPDRAVSRAVARVETHVGARVAVDVPVQVGVHVGVHVRVVGRLEKPFHKRDVLGVVSEAFGAVGRPPAAR